MYEVIGIFIVVGVCVSGGGYLVRVGSGVMSVVLVVGGVSIVVGVCIFGGGSVRVGGGIVSVVGGVGIISDVGIVVSSGDGVLVVEGIGSCCECWVGLVWFVVKFWLCVAYGFLMCE